jgi:hypothetical protein
MNLQKSFPNAISSTSTIMWIPSAQKQALEWQWSNINKCCSWCISDHNHLHHGCSDYLPKTNKLLSIKNILEATIKKKLIHDFVPKKFLHTSLHVSILDVHENRRFYQTLENLNVNWHLSIKKCLCIRHFNCKAKKSQNMTNSLIVVMNGIFCTI